MRVVAGTAGGRLLKAPGGRSTRPTSDRVREAMFAILSSMDAVHGATVVDLFAGSGALGIEALSRGATHATFVDTDPAAVAAVRANLAGLGDLAGGATVVRDDAVRWVEQRCPPSVDLVLADPPYAWDGWSGLLAALAGRAELVVAETGGPWEPGAGWETVRVRRYGSTVVSVVAPQAKGGQ